MRLNLEKLKQRLRAVPQPDRVKAKKEMDEDISEKYLAQHRDEEADRIEREMIDNNKI